MTAEPVLSPAVRRALEVQQARGWAYVQPEADRTLGDRVRADARFEPSEAEMRDLFEDLQREAR